MNIQPIKVPRITFMYQSPLKTEWLRGNMPDVTHDIYGDILRKKQVSIEHIIPRSQRGANSVYNYALANRETNNARGTEWIGKFTNSEIVKKYLKQFTFVRLDDFNGRDYIKGVTKTFKLIGFKL